MFNLGAGELLIIAVLALIVLGPERIPSAMRQMGRVMGEVRRVSSEFQDELRSALEEEEIRGSGPVDVAGAEVRPAAELPPEASPDGPDAPDAPPTTT